MHPQQDFIVIDTEGKNELREIAIIDSQGKLIYEAFAKEHPDNYEKVLNLKPIREIFVDFLEITKTKLIIFHYAKHDIQVLKNSCKKVSLPWENLTFECSCVLAKAAFPGLGSYSLEYLSKHLNLKVNQSYFDVNLAHIARYDAEFTYQLYLKLMTQAPKAPLIDTLRDKPNPFGSSRVDNPFQDHVDFKEIYQDEFEILKSVITDIKHDKNHQSKGAIVIGEPGSGKTHLMMRLAKELLKVNRLLFIRQPNNPDDELEIILNQHSIRSVLNRASDYYQYKVHNVPLPERSSSPSKPIVSEAVQERLTLLENELAKLQKKARSSFREEQENIDVFSQTLQELDDDFTNWKQVVSNLVEDVQFLYIKTEELEQKTKELDKRLEKIEGEDGGGGPSPLILYLQRQKTLIEQESTQPKIISDSDDIGKLRTIAQAFKNIKDFELNSLRLGSRRLPEHLVIQSEHQSIAIGFLQINGGSFTARIQNWNELVLRQKDTSFKILRDRRQPEITGKVGKEEIEKLNNASQGSFIIMEQENRISFELIYKLIIDIQERDVDFALEEALPDLIDYLDNYWLINLFEQFENI